MNYKKYDRLAFLFDPLERLAERFSCFGKIRQKYVTLLEGKILEIGAGTGANFPYYSNKAEVIALEPSPKMLLHAKMRLEKLGKRNIKLEQGRAEKINYPDNYFDYVVSGLVFCSVDEPEQAMTEVRRVLKPGGRAIFIEHVSSQHKLINTILKILNPLQKAIIGCNLQRDTGVLIQKSGLRLLRQENIKLKDVFRRFEAQKL